MVYVEDIPGDRVQVLGESNVLDRQQVNDEFTCQGGLLRLFLSAPL